jgi:hypothetical protein
MQEILVFVSETTQSAERVNQIMDSILAVKCRVVRPAALWAARTDLTLREVREQLLEKLGSDASFVVAPILAPWDGNGKEFVAYAKCFAPREP